MGAVFTDSAVATVTAFGNQRKIDRCQNGVLWEARPVGNNPNHVFYYSTDNGSTWTQAPGINGANGFGSYTTNASLFIDLDDYAHYSYKDPGNGFIYYHRGTPNVARTAYAWSTALTVGSSQFFDFPDIVAHRDPANAGAWVAHVVYANTGTTSLKTRYAQIAISSAGAVSLTVQNQDIAASVTANGNASFPSIDFNNVGDAKTVKGGQPDLYVGWSSGATGAGNGIRFRKATYSAGSWTWGTEREVDNTLYLNGTATWLNCMYDGTRVVLAGWLFKGSDGSYSTVVHDRDAADTTTTPRTLANGSSTNAGAIARGSATYDSQGNVHRVGDSNGVVFSQRWVRSSGAVDPRVTIDSSDISSSFASTRRGPQGAAIDYVYTDGTASPYTVTSGRIILNTSPTAAAPTTPTAGSGVDRTQPITLAWVFNDPDAGDSQSKADIRYKLTSASTWTTILGATTTATSYALPANQAAGNYEWQVLTYDALGVASPWSASSFFTAGDPPGVPVITSPSAGGTVSNTHTVTWSSPQQDAYEVRRVADNAGSPVSGTMYATTGTVEDASSRARTVTFETNNRTEHVQVRVRYSGIWSQWASARVLVSYTPPATPVVVLTPQDATGSMLVSITNPAPSGSQPTVASHDILIDDGFGEGFTRRATGWAPGAPYTYWLPVSTRDYVGNIRVVAVATNSTTSTGVAT